METIIEGCQYCGVCCKLGDVVATEDEVEKIAEMKELDPKEFCWHDGRADDLYNFKWKGNGDCIFLEREGDRVYCDIYIFRPETCKEFPKTKEQRDQCPITQ